jgi:DNA-binding XRE family transcriptional regulator
MEGRTKMTKTMTMKSKTTAPSGVQVITDVATGNPAFAVVPWADYQRLAAASDETAMLIAAGNAARGDETFPEDVARRIVSGEVPLKVIREWRNLTQAQLAEASDVAAQYISQIERRAGGRTLGKEVARKLAPVLGVSADILMED